ncbi:DUF6895 family protein [Facklamia hominis]|uniref:DUF6895 family protein n=1 Tax=Facklamia hominis TaxID=178214 RepID=UPI0038FC5C4B
MDFELEQKLMSVYRYIKENRSLFLQKEKSRLEYYELMIFMKDFKEYNYALEQLHSTMIGNLHCKNILELFGHLDYDELSTYRKNEILAIDSLFSNRNWTEEITKNFKKSFLYNLIYDDYYKLWLANRDFLYSITHEIMYATIFNSTLITVDVLFNNYNKLIDIFEISLSFSIRNDDIDVLNELLFSAFILKIEDHIDIDILNAALELLNRAIFNNKVIFPNSRLTLDNIEESKFFEITYHTSLTGGFLLSVL